MQTQWRPNRQQLLRRFIQRNLEVPFVHVPLAKILTLHPGQHCLAILDRVLVLVSNVVDPAVVTTDPALLLAGLLDCHHRRCETARRPRRCLDQPSIIHSQLGVLSNLLQNCW